VSPTTATISVGGTQQLTATVLPSNATNKNVTWSSSNTAVTTVSTSGLVTAIAVGSATITVTTQDGNYTATSVITIVIASNTYTLFTSQTPASSATDNACELGMKFTSSQAGQIRKIRYYKPDTESGSHVGRLWSASGTLLTSASFSGETSSGWQEATMSSPFTIVANTTYVVSVNSNNNYAYTANGLGSMITNGPLSSIAGSNGVYIYASGSFPTNSHQNTNYFRDVTFSTSLSKGVQIETGEKSFEGNGIRIETSVTSSEDYGIKVYPNPASGFLYIQLNNLESHEFVISLYNTLSQKIVSVKTSETFITLNIEGCPKGLYILIIQSNMEKILKKVIIE
jgi:hypothetical protein